jgi:hypothetical protein
MASFKSASAGSSSSKASREFGEFEQARLDVFLRDSATAIEKEKIALMKAKIGDGILSKSPLCDQEENVCENKFLRFLRGYEDDAEKAADAYLAFLEFREENQIDAKRQQIVEHDYLYPNEWPEYKPIRDITAKGMRACYSKDHYGNIVTVTEIGECDVKGVIKAGLEDLYIDYNMTLEEWYNIELHKRSKEAKRLVGRQDIINVANLGSFQFNIQCYKLLQKATLGGTHYPEGSVRITSVGNGWMAIKMWNNVISPFVPERTKMKIRACGHDFLPVLLESIDLDQLPLLWGGIKNDTPFDALFATDKDNYFSANVAARSDKELRIRVDGANTKISYRWSLSDYTIAFESYFLAFQPEKEKKAASDGGEGGEREVEEERVEVDVLRGDITAKDTSTPEWSAGRSYTSPSAGEFVLRWDNSVSIFRSKSIRYKVTVDRNVKG